MHAIISRLVGGGAIVRRCLAMLACALLLIAPAAADSILYQGAARVMSLGHVVVVYPTRDDAGAARRSAELRAGFLRDGHGVDATVVRDEELTDDQLRDDLLILGWDNAVLRHEALDPPPQTWEGGWRWLGLAGNAHEDLMVGCPSPFNVNSRLTFWSRIDPELDRIAPLPARGSDWIVFDLFRPVALGMFAAREGSDPTAWPPRLSEMAQRDMRASIDEPPQLHRSAHYALHALRNVVSPEEAATILQARESAWAKAVAAIGDPGGSFFIDLIVYPDAETKLEESGVPDPWHSIPSLRQLHATVAAARSVSPHEDVHIIAAARFGAATISALIEGLAVAIERGGPDGPLSVDAAWLVDHDAVPPLDRLLDETGFRALTESKTGWPAAGLLVEWILDSGGVDAIKRVYGLADPTSAALAERLGRPLDELQSQYSAFVARRAAAGRDELTVQSGLADARRRLDAGDAAGAVAGYRTLLELRPKDAGIVYRLALAQIEGDDLAGAEGTLRGLIRSADPEADARWFVFAHYQLGLVAERDGRPAEALKQWRTMLDLADVSDSHRMAREAIERLDAEGSGEAGGGRD